MSLTAIRTKINAKCQSLPQSRHSGDDINEQGNVGRRFRPRQDKSLSDSPKAAALAMSSVPSTSTAGNFSIPGSPIKNSDGQDVSMVDLQSSLNIYFGVANRIANGENYTIKGKRISLEGEVQYLIDWEAVS